MTGQTNAEPTFESLARAGFEHDQALGKLGDTSRTYETHVDEKEPEVDGKLSYIVQPSGVDKSLWAHTVEIDEHETLAVSERRFTDSIRVTRSRPFTASSVRLTTRGSEGFHQTGHKVFAFLGKGGWELDVPIDELTDVEIIEKRGKKVVSRWVGKEALDGAQAEGEEIEAQASS